MKKADFTKVALVLAMGLAGGLVSYLLPTEPQADGPWKEIFCGMVASFLGVFLTDLHDKLSLVRILALALACGIFWKPVIEGSGDWLDKIRVQDNVATAQSGVQKLAEQADSKLKPERDELINTTSAAIQAAQSAAELPSTTVAVTATEEVRKLESLLDQLKTDFPQDPGFQVLAEAQKGRLVAARLALPITSPPPPAQASGNSGPGG